LDQGIYGKTIDESGEQAKGIVGRGSNLKKSIDGVPGWLSQKNM